MRLAASQWFMNLTCSLPTLPDAVESYQQPAFFGSGRGIAGRIFSAPARAPSA